MADINTISTIKRRPGFSRPVKHSLRTDMTPMVDLGFLLITFFVIVTRLSEPSMTPLYMPKGEVPTTLLGESNALTILLSKNNVLFYYDGDWDVAMKRGGIIKTSLSMTNGLGKVISEKQQLLDIMQKDKEGRNGLMLIIKADREASYKNLVNVLDEATIHIVKKYAIVRLTAAEKSYLQKQ
jgi:biopolymer transport protein ExbD